MIITISILYILAGLYTYYNAPVKSKLAASLWFIVFGLWLFWLIKCEKD